MTNRLKPAPQTLKAWTGWIRLTLAITILLGHTPFIVEAASSSKTAWPKRDFLPPTAVINPKLETIQAASSDNEVEAVSLVAVNSPILQTSPKVTRLDNDIAGQFKTAQMQGLLEIQQKVDEADLEYLWQAAVEKNPVIRFSLEKLATPADLQTKQSSKFLTKTLSTLISGATMASTMLPGGGAYRNMASMAGGNALQNIVTGKTQITPGSLSATEQIQLASLIDELKIKLIRTYQDYKNTLQALTQSHETTLKNNNMYSKALGSKNDLAIMAAGTAYYQALMTETTLRQKAKVYRLELERLAGGEAVSSLELAAHSSEGGATTASATPPIGPVLPDASSSNPASSRTPLPNDEPAAPASMDVAMPIGPEEPPVGPELPAAKQKTSPKGKKQTAKVKKAAPVPVALPLELPEPMEIGPTLQEGRIAVPLPQAESTPSTTPRSAKKTVANTPTAMPLPILDSLLEATETPNSHD